jgi:hypothetical protein
MVEYLVVAGLQLLASTLDLVGRLAASAASLLNGSIKEKT